MSREPVTVVFSVWGQRSETIFGADAELSPEQWLITCYDKGFLYPIEMRRGEVVIYDQDELVKMVMEAT
jgi:hypothetical protein